MPDNAPTGVPGPWRFDIQSCRSDLDAFGHLLASSPALAERGDILPFFRDHPHLSVFLASYHPNVTNYDRLAIEVPLAGQFVADIVAGDRDTRSYCFIEFEDGTETRLFVRRGCHMTEWSARFDRAFSQIVDWFWLLDDQQQTQLMEDRFGPRPLDVAALLVIGRDAGVSTLDRRRLEWRRDHVLVDSHHVFCCTFDELARGLRRRLYAWISLLSK